MMRTAKMIAIEMMKDSPERKEAEKMEAVMKAMIAKQRAERLAKEQEEVNAET